MKILVTGGTGSVGQGVVARLVKNGHQVRVVDRNIQQNTQPGAEFVACDITNFEALRQQMRGQEAVIHLAAYAYPAAASGSEIFRVNCWGTYQVYEAAAVEGIRRIASASSINALGYNFGVKSFPIQYFPIDEDHPTFTTDPYSFSKQTTEAIAAYYWRRDGISSTCLRMPLIYTLNEEMLQWIKPFSGGYQRLFEKFNGLPQQERKAQVQILLAALEEERTLRLSEKPYDADQDWEMNYDDPAMLMHFGYTDFWSILSVEDAAQAFEKSLLAEFEGSHPLYLSEQENSTRIESEALLQVFYPQVTARRKPIIGASALVDYEKAHQLIGFEPEYILRNRL